MTKHRIEADTQAYLEAIALHLENLKCKCIESGYIPSEMPKGFVEIQFTYCPKCGARL